MDYLSWFKSKSRLNLEPEDLVEHGVCPNCWGEQEWEDQYIAFAEDREKDFLNRDRTGQKAFIEKFITEYITGIRLKREGDRLVCPRCTGGYKVVSGKAN